MIEKLKNWYIVATYKDYLNLIIVAGFLFLLYLAWSQKFDYIACVHNCSAVINCTNPAWASNMSFNFTA